MYIGNVYTGSIHIQYIMYIPAVYIRRTKVLNLTLKHTLYVLLLLLLLYTGGYARICYKSVLASVKYLSIFQNIHPITKFNQPIVYNCLCKKLIVTVMERLGPSYYHLAHIIYSVAKLFVISYIHISCGKTNLFNCIFACLIPKFVKQFWANIH